MTDTLRIIRPAKEAPHPRDLASRYEAPISKLTAPSFSRIVTFHLPTLLRSANADAEILALIPGRSDSLEECKRKLEKLSVAAYTDASFLTGKPLELVLEVAFTASGLRAYLEVLSDETVDHARLLRVIERHSGRLIIETRARAYASGARRWMQWWPLLKLRLRF